MEPPPSKEIHHLRERRAFSGESVLAADQIFQGPRWGLWVPGPQPAEGTRPREERWGGAALRTPAPRSSARNAEDARSAPDPASVWERS